MISWTSQPKQNKWTGNLNHANSIDKHLNFKLSTEENNLINYLDLALHRNNSNIDLEIYRKPTAKDTIIHFSSRDLFEHKLAAF